jgi:hypothetical protein
MERSQETAQLDDTEWSILENTILPLARDAATSGGYLEHTGSDRSSWMYWSGISSDNVEGIQAVCTSPNGDITDYCIEIATRKVSRIFLSGSMPDVNLNMTAIGQPDGLSISDVVMFYPGDTDTSIHSSLAEVQTAVNDQLEFGTDNPSGAELELLRIFVAEHAGPD